MNTADIVKNIAFGNYEIAKNAINHVLLTKTAIALDEKKKVVAKNMYCEECNMNEEKDRYKDGDPKAADRGDRRRDEEGERGRIPKGSAERSDSDRQAADAARKKRINAYRRKASKGKPIF
jgi:hypothetical protein